MTNIYYRRVTTYKKYPENDVIENDVIQYSTKRKPFYDNIFFQTKPSLDMKERKMAVAEHLKTKQKNIELIKL